MLFNKPDISYKPLDIEIAKVSASHEGDNLVNLQEDEILANKLMSHLALVSDYQDKIKAIDYLIDNARKLAGSLSYETNRQDILEAINALGFQTNVVDIKIFEAACDAMSEHYKTLALISFTGVLDNASP